MTEIVMLDDTEIVRIVMSYYEAVDSGDADRLADVYLASATTTLKFNADDPIVSKEAIRAFSAQFFSMASVRHSQIDVWKTPLMGDVVPVELAHPRGEGTLTVISTALPTFTLNSSGGPTELPLPATSIFTIDLESGKLASVHNMFDLGKVFAAAADPDPTSGRR